MREKIDIYRGIILGEFRKAKKAGLFLIFVSNILAKGVAFLGGVILIRILSKTDYGLYSYVLNCYGILSILADFGFSQALMQYKSEYYYDSERCRAYFVKSFIYGIASTAVSSILVVLSPLFYPFSFDEAKPLTQALCLLPFLTTISSLIIANVRAEAQNKKFAQINILQTISHYIFIIPFALIWNVKGAVASNYFIGIVNAIIAIWLSINLNNFRYKKDVLNKVEEKSFVIFAFTSQLNSCIGQLFNLVDIFFIGLIVGNSEMVSSYKVACTIPQSLNIIPTSILVFVIPFFARNINNLDWVKKNYRKLLLSCATVNGLLAIIFIAASPFLIPIVFGRQYEDAITCSIILMISFFVSGSFHIPSANIIYTQHKVKINVLITIVTNVVNCILDALLIRHFGSIGAAVATLSVSIIAGVLSTGYMISFLQREAKM